MELACKLAVPLRSGFGELILKVRSFTKHDSWGYLTDETLQAGSGKMDEFSSGKGASLETNKNLSSDYDDESILGVLTVEESHLVRDQFSNDENHMAELEAELEAELDRLTGNNLVNLHTHLLLLQSLYFIYVSVCIISD